MRLVLTLSVLFVAAVAVDASAPPAPQSSAPMPPPGTSADTLRYEVASGDPLVVALPGPEGAQFRLLHAPALTHLADRALAWQTLPAERGRELILVARTHGARTDTLVLAIEVR